MGLPSSSLPVVGDGAAVRLYQAGDGAQRGGLARAVGADQGDDLAVGHLQADAAQRLDAAVGYAQILNLQHLLPPPDMRR